MFKRTKSALCLAAVLSLAGALPAAANNTQTINTSDAYVDLSIAAAFTTIPNLCTENVGEQNLSVTACDALGVAAVEAANGSGISTDQYFESRQPVGAYNSTNAFVPNGGTIVSLSDSGYRPIFSQHKYNLFGRGDELMGPLSREEILFVGLASGEATVSQTEPGNGQLWLALTQLMIEPAATTTSTVGGITFDIANLSFYTDLTGISTGGSSLANSFCISYFDSQLPGSGAIFCPLFNAAQKADIYLTQNAFALRPNMCAGKNNPGLVPNNCNDKDQWVDQVVVGYIESFDDPAVQANSNFVQNFRSQFNFDAGPLIANTPVLLDFRLEQANLLGGNAFEGARQTFQQTLASTSIFSGAPQIATSMGQLVTQDVQGWFSSCFNCDSALNNVSHAFTPRDFGLSFMPYTNTWRDLPSISHGESGGNLSVYAQNPGDPGP